MEALFAKHRHSRRTLPVLVLISLILVSLCATCTVYLLQFMRGDAAQYLNEKSTFDVETIDRRIQTNFSNLDILAQTFASLPDPIARRNLFYELEKTPYQGRIALAEPDGSVWCSSGRGLSLPDDPLLGAALAGYAAVDTSTAFSPDGSVQLVYAFPLFSAEETCLGTLLWHDTDLPTEQWFSPTQLLHSRLVRTNGDFIQLDSPCHNLFDVLSGAIIGKAGSSLEAMADDLATGQSGFLYLQTDEIESVLAYTPLASADWVLLTSHVLNTNHQFLPISLGLGLLLNMLFSLVTVFFLLLFYRAQRRYLKTLEQFAFYDPITGADNRVRFSLRAKQAIENTLSGAYCILSVDIQSFSLVNRIFGEPTGNQALQHLYTTLSNSLQSRELVAHLGKDHFALLLLQAPEVTIESRLESIAQTFNQFNMGKSTPYYLPLTVGICPVDDNTLPIDDLLDRANIARKKSKLFAENRLYSSTWYSPEDRERLLINQRIYNRMDLALEKGEFKVYLQPKISLVDHRVVGAEALVRWHDEEYGNIDPDSFIPLFERNGFIRRLDRYMFEQCCSYLRRWIDMGLTPVPISVNLSRADLNPDVLEWHKSIQQHHQLPDGLLEFELTETIVGQNPAFFANMVDEMHRLGFLCSMDDFGSGYSSLYMLQKVHVDILKLDKCLFDGLLVRQERERCEHIVSSVLTMARQLGLKTVAEGIGTQEQVAFLETLPCDMVQGYYFSPPLPAEEFRHRFLELPMQ